MALRIISLSCGLLLAAGLATGEAAAAGRGGGLAPAAPRAVAGVHAARQAGPVLQISGQRHLASRDIRHDGSRGWGRRSYGYGYGDPWLYPPGNTTVAVIERQPELVKLVDPDSFENLTARAGIRRGPTPEPTIYSVVGPRMAPGARVIRIGGAETIGGRQTRYAHAETGALLLMVPRR